MPQAFFDCIIVGLGPAGTIAAYTLAQAGYSVLALDKQVHPRPKICGGCLSRKIDTILPFSISSVIENTINEVVFTFKGQEDIEYILNEPFAYIIRREKFDKFLVEKATEAGAVINQGEEVIYLEEGAKYVSVNTKMGDYRGKVLIGADGVKGVVGRRLGSGYSRSSCLALEAETGINGLSAKGRIWIDMGWVDSGYGWIFPRPPLYSVGISDSRAKGVRLRRAFANFLATHPMVSGQKTPTVKGYRLPVSTCKNREKKIISNRVALTGDAAGLVNPLTGEGIYYALWSGSTLATCIIESNKGLSRALRDYEYCLKNQLYPQLVQAEQVAKLVYIHPWISFHLIRRYKELIGLFIEALVGNKPFSDLLSLLKYKLGLKDK